MVCVYTRRGWCPPLGTPYGRFCRALHIDNDIIGGCLFLRGFERHPSVNYFSVGEEKKKKRLPRQPTCAPLRWQLLRLLGTLCDATMGGCGARLFLGISAGSVLEVLEEETASTFTLAGACLLRPGEVGALTAPSFEERNRHFWSKRKEENVETTTNLPRVDIPFQVFSSFF